VSKITFELLEDELSEDKLHWTKEHPLAREQFRCLCGRFAKYGGDQHYYNGTFDCYRYFIDCTHCGQVTVECV
jgi:hypothetical protein